MTNFKNLKALKHRFIKREDKLKLHESSIIKTIIITFSLLIVGINQINNQIIKTSSAIYYNVSALSANEDSGLIDNEAINLISLPATSSEEYSVDNPLKDTKIIETQATISTYIDNQTNSKDAFKYTGITDKPLDIIIYGNTNDIESFDEHSLKITLDVTNLSAKNTIEAPIIIENIESSNLEFIVKPATITLNQSQIAKIELNDWITKLRKPVANALIICGWYGYAGHQALDIQNRNEFYTPVHAVAGGKVIEVSYDGMSGNYAVIDHQNGYTTRYGHLRDRASVNVGAYVKTNEIIGTTGMSGSATTPHVHFSMELNGKRINPTSLIFN